MSNVEIVSLLEKLRRITLAKLSVWIDGQEVLILNPSLQLTYDANGNLTEIRLSGTDPAGKQYTVRKTLSYDASGNLTAISAWEVV